MLVGSASDGEFVLKKSRIFSSLMSLWAIFFSSWRYISAEAIYLKIHLTVCVFIRAGWVYFKKWKRSMWPNSSYNPILLSSLTILNGLSETNLIIFGWFNYLSIEYSCTRRSTDDPLRIFVAERLLLII